MIRKGKRTNQWERIRRKLKEEFEQMGVIYCELKYRGCWYDNALGFAHKKKRRFLQTDEELREVILACNNCHDIIEVKPHAEMQRIVEEVIEKRNLKLSYERHH